MKAVFVTGTDTGVGKTLAALALLYALRRQGVRAIGMKPVAAGTISRTGPARNDDALALIEASTIQLPYEHVNPYCYREPIAPHIAAEEEAHPIEIAVIKRAFAEIQAQGEYVVVEGAGGWLVPISANQTMADMAREMKWPVILVVGLRLGCLNHTLLTVDSIQQKGLPLVGWIGNRLSAEFNKAEQNITSLRQRIDAPCLGVFPYRENADAEKMSHELETLPFD